MCNHMLKSHVKYVKHIWNSCETHVITCEHMNKCRFTCDHMGFTHLDHEHIPKPRVSYVFHVSFTYFTCDYNMWLHMWSSCAFSVRDEFIALLIVCLHRKLSHNKLVQLCGVVTQRSPIYLVFEFMENGCLTDFSACQKRRFSQDVLLEMCLDVSEGMAYLETSNFISQRLGKCKQGLKVSFLDFLGQFVLKSSCLNRLHEIVWFLKITWWRYQILEWQGE